MAWKKIITSGSDANLNKINVRTSITASTYSGDGTGLSNTGIYAGGTKTIPIGTISTVSSSYWIDRQGLYGGGSVRISSDINDVVWGNVVGMIAENGDSTVDAFSGFIDDDFSGLVHKNVIISDDGVTFNSVEINESSTLLRSRTVGTPISNNGISADVQSVILFNESGDSFGRLTMNSNGTIFSASGSSHSKGIQYNANLSSNYTNRSLVDKEYTDRIRTGSYLNISHTGSMSLSGSFKVRSTKSMFTGSVNITGTLSAAVKSFSIPHQTAVGKQLVYGVSESPEHTVFVRGKLIDNNIIFLPKEWEWLVDENSITVQLTPINIHQQLFVDKIEDNKVYINSNTNHILRCHYLIHGERKDISKLINIQ